MLRIIKQWLALRNQASADRKLAHPVSLSKPELEAIDASLVSRLEKTGLSTENNRKQLLHDPTTDRYWFCEFVEQGMFGVDRLTSVAVEHAESAIQNPSLFVEYCKTGLWAEPRVLPAKVHTNN